MHQAANAHDRGVHDPALAAMAKLLATETAQDAVDTAIHTVRGGGTISMVGVPSAVQGDFPYLRMWLKSLTFRAGWCNVQAYMRPMLDLIAAGRLHPEKIISHRMKLDQAEEAYRIFDAREATKIVLTP